MDPCGAYIDIEKYVRMVTRSHVHGNINIYTLLRARRSAHARVK